MEIVNIYMLEHKLSSSQAQITCAFDANKNPKISSVTMLAGKVVSLHGVRTALDHFKEEQGVHEEPNQTA